ncbi:hypothetical protein ACIGXM_01080 [Kitasatospora sp. NPDC052896]|uniref:hypothetical protein n=1 Tax=Kitasatospora sp. NPDC052896 TaxID=3364061 RepID=UPI0037C7CD97
MAARRRAAALVVAAGLIGGLAACGGSSHRAGPSPSPSTASPSPTGARPTDRSPRGVMLSSALELQSARRAKFSYQFTGPAATDVDSADGVLFWAPRTVMQLTHTTPGATDQLIVLDTVAYQGGDAATAAKLGGKHWQKTDETTGPDGRPEIPFSTLIDQINPLYAVTAAAAAPDLQLLGEEKVGDASTEHYQATVTVADYAAAQQALLTPARSQALAGALSQGGVTTLTLDLWLNDKDQPVQLHLLGSGSQGTLEHTVDYSDYGGAFAVQAPAESDTQD